MHCKLIHYSIDAALLSCCLAGIKRSTGLAYALSYSLWTPADSYNRIDRPALNRIRSKDVRQLVSAYLEMGEWMIDLGIVVRFLAISLRFSKLTTRLTDTGTHRLL